MTDQKHPSEEQLVLFLYQEMEHDAAMGIESHLADCGDCSAKINRWSDLQSELDFTLKPEPVNRKKQSQSTSIGISSLLNVVALLLIAVGAFVWGTRFDRSNQNELVSELKKELTTIKRVLADQQTQPSPLEIHNEIEAIKIQLTQASQSDHGLTREDFRKLLRQVVAISNQTTRLRDEISSLAVNAHAEIEKNRQAVTQLYVNSELANQTFEVQNP